MCVTCMLTLCIHRHPKHAVSASRIEEFLSRTTHPLERSSLAHALPWEARMACADWGKEHSLASRRCIWHAILQIDYHSLMRQANDVMLSVLEQHLVSTKSMTKHRLWPGVPPGDKFSLLLVIIGIAHSVEERCGRWRHDHAGHDLLPLALSPRPLSLPTQAACGLRSSFDVKHLPYRWLPGLPSPQVTITQHEATHARRFEVMHIAD